VKRSHVAAVAALAVLAVPALTGCWNGQRATTAVQADMNSGNGVETDQGPLHIENATIVLGPEGSKTATLVMRVVNTGDQADSLTTIMINGQPASISVPGVAADSGADIGPGESVPFGFEAQRWINTYTFDAPVSTYVPVELGFTNAGVAKLSVLTVPPAGYYAGIAPNPPMAAVAPTASSTPAPLTSAQPSDAAAASASAAPSPSASAS
jgi:hypothetical protein